LAACWCRWLTAPFAIVTDALSYLASGLLISAIRARESPPSPAGRRGLWPEIWEGVAFVIRQPLLRPVMIAGSMLMLFETAWTSIQAVFLVRDLRLPATMYGLLLAVGAAGGLAGALCASRVIQRFGASRVVRLMLATTTPVMLVMPLSEAGWRLALYPARRSVRQLVRQRGIQRRAANNPAAGVPGGDARPGQRDDAIRDVGVHAARRSHRRRARPVAGRPAGPVVLRSWQYRRYRPAPDHAVPESHGCEHGHAGSYDGGVTEEASAGPAGRRSYPKGVRRRQQILESAIALFAQRGVDSASLRTVGEAIGVSHAALRHYFSSRDELLVEVYRTHEALMVEDALAADESAVGVIAEAAERNRSIPGLVELYATLTTDALQERHAVTREFVRDRFQGLRETLAARIESGQQEGRIAADIDPLDAAALVIAASDGLQIQWLLDPGAVDVGRSLSILERLLPRDPGPSGPNGPA
jgi:AcrR family transcriptional regulator